MVKNDYTSHRLYAVGFKRNTFLNRKKQSDPSIEANTIEPIA